MNIFNLFKKPKEVSLKDLCKIINAETLTQLEVAKKLSITPRTVKQQTKDGKLNVLRFRGRTLYPKTNLKVKK